MNTLKTVFLMTLMMALFLFVGQLFGGQSGLMIAFVFALIMNFGSYWFSDKIVLAVYKAKPIEQHQPTISFPYEANLQNNHEIKIAFNKGIE